MIDVSVVVPTCGRRELQRCLEALAQQDYRGEYEVIVVQDGPAPLPVRWSGRAPLRTIQLDRRRGPAAARNAGWRAAQGRVVGFTDDDCIPHLSWLSYAMEVFTDGVSGASGRILVPLTGVPTDYERNTSRLQYSEFVTANCFYRRDVLADIGGFDERFTSAWREDTDLYFRLLARPSRLVRVPDAVVTHPVRPEAFGVSLRQQAKSMFNALLYKKHRRLYRRQIQASPPWQYYSIVGSLLAAVATGVLGHRLRSLGFLVLWIGLTARFCRRRLTGTSHHPRHVLEMLVTSVLIPSLCLYWRLRGAVRFRVFFL